MNQSPRLTGSAWHPWRTEIRATLLLALPLILTNIAQSLIGATDLVLLGRSSSTALAAGALGVNLVNACLLFGWGLVTAAAPMIARELGRNRHSVRDVRRTVRQAMWTVIAVAVPCWVLLWHAGALLAMFGQEPILAAAAGGFVRAYMWGLLPFFFYLVLRAFVSALEMPGWPLVIGGLAVLVNAGVNYVLIFGGLGIPALGLVGAGIGSSLSNLMMFLAMILVIARHPHLRRFRLFGQFWRPDWPRFAQVWRLGLPIAVTLTLEVTVFSAVVFLMGWIGADQLAAHAIAIQIAALSFMVPLGLSQAVTVRVGLAFGRGDAAGVTRAGWTSFVIGSGFMMVMSILLLTIPRPLIGLFVDAHDPANARVIAFAISFLAIAALFQIVDGAQAVGSGMLRGLHDTAVPMLYAAFGYWAVGLSLGYMLAFHAGWGGIGLWTGLAAGLATVAILMLARWLRRERIGLIGPHKG